MAIKKSNYDPAAMFGATSNLTTLTEATTLCNEQSGRKFLLNAAAGFAVTLPAANSGLEFEFIVKTAPSTGTYTIVTDSSANIIIGKAVNSAGDAGDTGSTDDTISFVQSQAVAGDTVKLICDGSYWYAYGVSAVAAGITFTTAS